MEKESKEGTDEFQPEWDTDRFETTGVDGLERDKSGELAVLLPAGDSVVARLRGFASRRTEEEGGEPPTGLAVLEKGSRFSGILRDKAGVIPIGQAETKGLVTQAPGTGVLEQAIAPEPFQAPREAAGEPGKPSVMDFDLDFGPATRKDKQEKPQETPAVKAKEPEPGKIRKAPTWAPPDEKKPMAAPTAWREAAEVKKEMPFEEPEIPEKLPPPIVIKGPRPKAAVEEKAKSAAEVPPIEARSYLEGESVIKKPEARPPRKKKKKMKLPKRVTKEKTRPMLVLLMVLVFLVLAGILAVQYVPEVRKYYEDIVNELLGRKKTGGDEPPARQPEGDAVVIEVGAERVTLKKGTDLKAVESYTGEVRKMFSEGGRAAAGKGN